MLVSEAWDNSSVETWELHFRTWFHIKKGSVEKCGGSSNWETNTHAKAKDFKTFVSSKKHSETLFDLLFNAFFLTKLLVLEASLSVPHCHASTPHVHRSYPLNSHNSRWPWKRWAPKLEHLPRISVVVFICTAKFTCKCTYIYIYYTYIDIRVYIYMCVCKMQTHIFSLCVLGPDFWLKSFLWIQKEKYDFAAFISLSCLTLHLMILSMQHCDKAVASNCTALGYLLQFRLPQLPNSGGLQMMEKVTRRPKHTVGKPQTLIPTASSY